MAKSTQVSNLLETTPIDVRNAVLKALKAGELVLTQAQWSTLKGAKLEFVKSEFKRMGVLEDKVVIESAEREKLEPVLLLDLKDNKKALEQYAQMKALRAEINKALVAVNSAVRVQDYCRNVGKEVADK